MRSTYKTYARIVEKFKSLTILHLGDLVLDQFLFGEISRISREAPVLILKYRETINIPGGGANAIHNLLTLGARVLPIGALGRDEAGGWLYKFFRDMGVDVTGIMRKDEYCTPVKTRILAGAFHSSMQQMLRIDRENVRTQPICSVQEITRSLEKFLPQVNAVMISDYGYGFIHEHCFELLRDHCRQRGIPIIVDSRFEMRRFKEVTSVTPNISEVEESYQTPIGEDLSKMDKLAAKILKELHLEALLITRGRYGMSLYQKKEKPAHISVFGSDEVSDVTGAGDTVISVYTLALAAGADFETAARLSNYAGGIVVMKRGTATVSTKELMSAIRSDFRERKLQTI
ncbi:MAG: bifunctional hydroxymethylpyrimidine kinase/phosphomethylpyrimidine kinase [Acidobacteria bacterium]|nr:bifunctional hydroxymethylpyrimidine kinase/phosphomethylpyrimidine kinase [Acidobacteriota bacterium]